MRPPGTLSNGATLLTVVIKAGSRSERIAQRELDHASGAGAGHLAEQRVIKFGVGIFEQRVIEQVVDIGADFEDVFLPEPDLFDKSGVPLKNSRPVEEIAAERAGTQLRQILPHVAKRRRIEKEVPDTSPPERRRKGA